MGARRNPLKIQPCTGPEVDLRKHQYGDIVVEECVDAVYSEGFLGRRTQSTAPCTDHRFETLGDIEIGREVLARGKHGAAPRAQSQCTGQELEEIH